MIRPIFESVLFFALAVSWIRKMIFHFQYLKVIDQSMEAWDLFS